MFANIDLDVMLKIECGSSSYMIDVYANQTLTLAFI